MGFIKSILRIFRSVVLLLLLVCLVIFMLDNREAITISTHPLPFEIQTKVFVMMIVFFVFGLIFGVIACSPAIVQNFFKRLSDQYRISKLEKQIKNN